MASEMRVILKADEEKALVRVCCWVRERGVKVKAAEDLVARVLAVLAKFMLKGSCVEGYCWS
jgi:hypothetical protein